MTAETAQIAGLFSSWGAKMRAWADRLLGSADAADDIVQEVMLGLLRAPHVLAGIENPGAWLYTIVRRRCVDEIRRSSRRREVEAGDELAELFGGELAETDAVEEEEFLAAVIAAVERLPGPLRQVFIGHVLEERTYREMSAASGVPMGTLMARKKRAVDLIRIELKRTGWIPTDGYRPGTT